MMACIEGRTGVVKLILDHPSQKIDLNARDNDGDDAFIIALENDDSPIQLLMLLEPYCFNNPKRKKLCLDWDLDTARPLLKTLNLKYQERPYYPKMFS